MRIRHGLADETQLEVRRGIARAAFLIVYLLLPLRCAIEAPNAVVLLRALEIARGRFIENLGHNYVTRSVAALTRASEKRSCRTFIKPLSTTHGYIA
jgi:hypothetical protein